MIDTRRPPPRGAFDYLLHGVEKTIWRDASLGEVPPPTHPPEPPRPQQVRIEIDIAEQRPQRQASQPATGGWGVGRLILAILVVSLLSALLGGCTAHAQSRFESYQNGGTTYLNGTTQDGRPFSGQSYQNGGTTYSTIIGPDGKTKRCTGYDLGSQRIVNCD
jgi:hypothetical protein